MKKVELLAPAGNYESFIAAINAGADAVYLAGTKFGARAYADNFSEEEVCQAIRYAHLFHKKIYMTINILLKEKELSELYDYLTPYYECGLDGVIVQDLGAFYDMKAHFPGLELHASTQMTLTGVHGAELLHEMGATRIVPARELSLDEIREIKKHVDIEIEAFVHGAECYCYSGACLFSSVIGGRSGNRGRCAQPCRLPYHLLKDNHKVSQEEQYMLSLKDMCTLSLIPELIEAGIDSFKIEGRMKKPEYAAGVTAMYRKYIDLYYKDPDHFHVSEEDLNTIGKLYIRSEIQDGYYHKHNGKEMVTLSKPSYSGSDEELLTAIRSKYIDNTKKLKVQVSMDIHVGQNMSCRITEPETGASVALEGAYVQEASNRPVEEESVLKQLRKTGNTNFEIENINLSMDNNVFVPLKSINEIRRESLSLLEAQLLGSMRTSIPVIPQVQIEHSTECRKSYTLDAVINTQEQLLQCVRFPIMQRVFVSSDLLFTDGFEKGKVDAHFQYVKDVIQSANKEFYLVMPYIIRKRSEQYLNILEPYLKDDSLKGVMIRNLESLQWLKKISFGKILISDGEIYCFNQRAKKFLLDNVQEVTASYEMNLKELLNLGLSHMVIPIYGRIPMMITANCLRKTMLKCTNDSHNSTNFDLMLEDRYQKNFYVNTNCLHCYNVIYNGQPTSLHGYIDRFMKYHVGSMRLDFTSESDHEVGKIIEYFTRVLHAPQEKIAPPYQEFTKGHLGRGVE